MIHSPKWLVLAALVSASPDTPGVYELWDGDRLLCVRGTHGGTLREELVQEIFARGIAATHFAWEITYRPLERERELLQELTAGNPSDI